MLQAFRLHFGFEKVNLRAPRRAAHCGKPFATKSPAYPNPKERAKDPVCSRAAPCRAGVPVQVKRVQLYSPAGLLFVSLVLQVLRPQFFSSA